MPHPPVYVGISFVSTKVGSKPAVTIDTPVEISDHLGVTRKNGYEKSKSRLLKIVGKPEYQLFFIKIVHIDIVLMNQRYRRYIRDK